MGLTRRLRGAAGSLLRRLRAMADTRERPFRPDLSEARFFQSLTTAAPLLAQAGRLFDAGDAQGARRCVLSHFEQRAAPAFFVEPRDVPSLAEHLHRTFPDWVDAMLARVDDEMRNGLKVMVRRHSPLGPGFEWHAIPTGPHGDTLHSAQPHRFGFLPHLVLAAQHGLSTPTAVEALLDGWMQAAEQGEPECYHSPLAVLYRVLALSWAWTFAAAWPADAASRPRVLLQILRILGEDMRYLLPTIGTSYPNNHLLADGFAGWYLGTLYPEFALAAQCRAQGEPLFVTELLRQFLADGSNFEHATHYHELGCEMASAYVLLSRRNGVEPAPAVVGRLQAMLHFQCAVGGPEAQPFVMGDSTDDPLFPLDVGHSWANGAMRELYRGLFDERLSAARGSDVERAFWLLGGTLAPEPAPPAAPEPPLALHFDLGGVHVMQDVDRRARLIFRSGPTEGQAISAGHANADLMSVTLNVDGRPVIVGAGTCSYRFPRRPATTAEPDWRSYLAGPDAHNGLVGVPDPMGAMVGDFRDRDVDCRVVLRHRAQGPGLLALEAEVTRGPQRGHRRGVVHVRGCYWLIYDLLPGRLRSGQTGIGLQFAAGAAVTVLPGGHCVEVVDGACRVILDAGFEAAEVLTGLSEPRAGWIAPRYGCVVPAPQLRARIGSGQELAAFVVRAGVAGGGMPRVQSRRDADGLQFEFFDAGSIDTLQIRWDTAPSDSNVPGAPPQRLPVISWCRRREGILLEQREATA